MKQKKYFNEFVDQIILSKDKKSLGNFFAAILTPKEILEISTRLQIIKLLKSGVSQKETASKLGVGVATVTRGAKELQKGNFSDIK